MSDLLRAAIRDVPDFPQPGIVFKDITPVLADPTLFHQSVTLLCATVLGNHIDKVVGIDARGFIFAAAVADRMHAGFVPIRKVGKLPWKTRSAAYTLEYGEAMVEMHDDAIRPGDRVLLVDDLLATGGTAAAALELITAAEGEIIAVSFLIELSFLNGGEKLAPHPVHSILRY